MATVICYMTDCIYRSKRPSKKYTTKDGGKCYGCMKDAIAISRIPDPDDYVINVVGEENMGTCLYYTPQNEIIQEEDE